ncbi:sulfoxide reductase catalytic subunit YedY precursor [bacterium BMS3Bbin11]|nr:sulfoxide reductase catalytic subunit YedY precursor [bacterium BMS3Abin11]GBE45383.1 sulfoxide reductase catalytic subunit YedY precursor [bacterium BMS3Bbin11]HDH08162.1 protein-methionine-sulfoxide reductase catalytic subunit MsrP [Gammaproteobacteria bacterium]HDH16242.1 protein-methionine-sulfoxide reductase catalytic subunit MsrP [Gammaproteobacteria bacterium]HDZ78275.1 protein-methionine-sulfoxide reductase catalytic subunit MsrP [Gammaproteobacteria bacterium]
MLIKRSNDIEQFCDIKPSEITSKEVYQSRRHFLQGGATLAFASGLGLTSMLATQKVSHAASKFSNLIKSPFNTDETLTPYKDVTTYNNFYEFGTSKSSPAGMAKNFKVEPWTIAVSGEVEKPLTLDMEDILKHYPMEERIYRLRCVEAWSMVVPWVGFPLASLIKDLKPTSKAKYISFRTLHDPKRMAGQKPTLFGSGLDWPYREGLRMDEAMNPLAILAVGLYGKVMPNQNGAPIRLIVPWKYGFKSIKSIVSIEFTENQPETTWAMLAPKEYGFYANVNPEVDHPRWSQSRERRLGEFRKRKTLMFNGYAKQVASMYKDLDMKKFF